MASCPKCGKPGLRKHDCPHCGPIGTPEERAFRVLTNEIHQTGTVRTYDENSRLAKAEVNGAP